MPPDGFYNIIEWQLTKVFSIVVFASTGFHSREARRTFFLQNIENQCGHCDYWLHWSKGLRLFMEFAQDATWWFSPLHRMSPNKGSVCQIWISLSLHRMPPDGSHHFIECHLTKVVFARTGFHSWEARRTLILQNIENQCGHWDYWLHW
jgi:pyrroloquinoline quinone (PQQ) biosynthesis protein C